MEINERLKKIRNNIGLRQAEFAKAIGIGHSTLGMMEIGKREIKSRYIKTICSMFNVNENWFRTGNGEMFNESKDNLLEKLSEQYHLSPIQRKMLAIFIDMDDKKREILSEAFFSFVETANTFDFKEKKNPNLLNRLTKPDNKLTKEEKLRLLADELEAEEKTKTLPVFTGTNGM